MIFYTKSPKKIKLQSIIGTIIVNFALILLWMFAPKIKHSLEGLFRVTIPLGVILTTNNHSLISPILVFTLTIPLITGVLAKIRLKSKNVDENTIIMNVIFISWITSTITSLVSVLILNASVAVPFIFEIVVGVGQFYIQCYNNYC